MYQVILSGFLILGILLLFLILKKIPIQDGIIIFLFSSYLAVILGTIVVEEEMLDYPVKLFGEKHFQSSILFEMLLLPVICLYFYRTTLHSKTFQIVFQSVIYSAVLTGAEYLIERHTPFIEYYTWTWAHTFISEFLFFILIRTFTRLMITQKT